MNLTLRHGEGGDSFNILPVLRGETLQKNVRPLSVLQGDARDDARAVRSGPSKLVESKSIKGGHKHPFYDLIKDPGKMKKSPPSKPKSCRNCPQPSRRSTTTAEADHDHEKHVHPLHRSAACAVSRGSRR